MLCTSAQVAESVSGGGDCLVYMASSPTLEGRSGLYLNNGIASYGVHRCVGACQVCLCIHISVGRGH